MQNAKELFKNHIELLEKTIITFNINENEAVELLEEVKKNLSEKHALAEGEREFYEPAVYNALAVINSCPSQKSANRQLIEALTDAKEELKAISEFI